MFTVFSYLLCRHCILVDSVLPITIVMCVLLYVII